MTSQAAALVRARRGDPLAVRGDKASVDFGADISPDLIGISADEKARSLAISRSLLDQCEAFAGSKARNTSRVFAISERANDKKASLGGLNRCVTQTTGQRRGTETSPRYLARFAEPSLAACASAEPHAPPILER